MPEEEKKIKGQWPNQDGQCYCEKEKKWMREPLFFTYKDGSNLKCVKNVSQCILIILIQKLINGF